MSYRCHLLPVEEKKHIRIYVMRDRQVNPPTEGSKHAEVIFAMFTNNWDSGAIGFVLKSKKRRPLSRITRRQYYLPLSADHLGTGHLILVCHTSVSCPFTYLPADRVLIAMVEWTEVVFYVAGNNLT